MILTSACLASSSTSTIPGPTVESVPATTATSPAPDFTATVDLTSLGGRLAVAGETVTVMDPDGDGPIEVFPQGAGSQPTWSPDGGRLAFSAVRDGAPVVGVVEPGSEPAFIVAPFPAFYFHWSPDGRQIAFLGNGAQGLVSLAVAAIDDDAATMVDEGTPYYFDWAPDSSTMFAHVGGTETRLVPPTGPPEAVEANSGLYQAPQWTERGVLQLITQPGTISARGARLRAQTVQTLVWGELDEPHDDVVEIEGLGAFEAAGRRIAFSDSTDPPTRGGLSVIDGDVLEEVTTGPVLVFEWSPDGRRLLYLEAVSSGAIPTTRWSVWQDGEIVTFGGFTPSLVSLAAYFPFWDQYSRSLTLWSPDGEAFVYSALDTETGESNIVVQPVEDGAPPVNLGPGGWASWSS